MIEKRDNMTIVRSINHIFDKISFLIKRAPDTDVDQGLYH